MIKRKGYNAQDPDLFASAVMLFIMVFGTPPFSNAVEQDPWYNLIAKGNT